MIGFLIALLSGALMSIQGVFNTQVTKTAGMWVSNAWVQLSAFAVCAKKWQIFWRSIVENMAAADANAKTGSIMQYKATGSIRSRWII